MASADVWIELFNHHTKSRRLRMVQFVEAYDICLRTRSWTDCSPITACGLDPIACDDCLVERHVINLFQDDPFCPQRHNPWSTEDCVWGRYHTTRGVCDDCNTRIQFGCGWGRDHRCAQCVYSNHHSEENLVECGLCGPCGLPICEESRAWHCRMVCPFRPDVEICG